MHTTAQSGACCADQSKLSIAFSPSNGGPIVHRMFLRVLVLLFSLRAAHFGGLIVGICLGRALFHKPVDSSRMLREPLRRKATRLQGKSEKHKCTNIAPTVPGNIYGHAGICSKYQYNTHYKAYLRREQIVFYQCHIHYRPTCIGIYTTHVGTACTVDLAMQEYIL